MSLKMVFFDFNGTIANTENATVEVYNKLQKKYKLNFISPEQIMILKSRSPIYYAWKLGMRPWNYHKIKADSSLIVSSLIAQAVPYKELKESLAKLVDKGIKLSIISANNYDDISNFIQKHQLNYFTEIHAGITLNKKHKTIKKILSSHRLLKSETLFIGDEVRDYESSQKAGVPFLYARWGLNTVEEKIKNVNTFDLNSPSDLVTLLENNL